MLRILFGTPLWLAFAVRMSLREGYNFFAGDDGLYTPAIKRWLSCGGDWATSVPHNLYMKALEITLFSNLELRSPSMEIGGGGGDTSRLAFNGKRIDVDCEYFPHHILNNLEAGKDIYKVTDLHVGGSVYALPFRDGVFGAVVMVHIADHLVDIDGAFRELSRVLKKGGTLAFSTYSSAVFDHLPIARMLRTVSDKVARRYMLWRRSTRGMWRKCGPYQDHNPEDAAGQNLLSSEEWRELGLLHGLELVQCRPFTVGDVWITMADLYRRGNPRLLRKPLRRLISHLVQKELLMEYGLAEGNSANVFLVFQKGKVRNSL